MHELTEIEKAVITLLAHSNIKPREAAFTLIHLQTEDQMLAMGEYLIEHEEATGQEILNQAKWISHRFPSYEEEEEIYDEES